MEENRFRQLGQVAKPSSEMVKLIILEHQYNVDQALEDVDRHEDGDDHSIIEFKARLKSYLRTLLPYLEIHREKQLQMYIKASQSKELNKLKNLYASLDKFCYDLGLTKIETQKVYDSTDAIAEDEAKGLY